MNESFAPRQGLTPDTKRLKQIIECALQDATMDIVVLWRESAKHTGRGTDRRRTGPFLFAWCALLCTLSTIM